MKTLTQMTPHLKRRIAITMKKRIKDWNGYFYYALETKDFIYYANYQQGGENSCVKMFRKSNNELVSDNYFACIYMYKALIENKYTWISRYMERNLKLYLEVK